MPREPRHKWSSFPDFMARVLLKWGTVRSIGMLPNPVVPSYTAVDARLGWRVSRDFDVSLALQNLFDPSHPEFSFGTAAMRSEFERAAMLNLQWRM